MQDLGGVGEDAIHLFQNTLIKDGLEVVVLSHTDNFHCCVNWVI